MGNTSQDDQVPPEASAIQEGGGLEYYGFHPVIVTWNYLKGFSRHFTLFKSTAIEM